MTNLKKEYDDTEPNEELDWDWLLPPASLPAPLPAPLPASKESLQDLINRIDDPHVPLADRTVAILHLAEQRSGAEADWILAQWETMNRETPRDYSATATAPAPAPAKAVLVPAKASPLWTHAALHRNEKMAMKADRHNLHLILSEHPAFKGRLAFNEFTYRPCWDGKRIQDEDTTLICRDLSTLFSIDFKREDVRNMCLLIARERGFHPVRDYLSRTAWDGQDRMTEFCSLLGVEPTLLNVAVATKWLMSAVARVMQPGCKVDSAVVLQGTQGTGKSQVIKALSPDRSWVLDEAIDPGSKDWKELTQGKWLVEMAELTSKGQKDNNALKAELTTTVDEFRPPYGGNKVEYPRQFIFVGTTNDPEFLTDATGNRRFWVMPQAGAINTDRVRAIRDQLWAQAVSLFQIGTDTEAGRWWLTAAQAVEMAVIGARHEVVDPWQDAIETYLQPETFATVPELLGHIKARVGEQTTFDRKRIVKILQTLKWQGSAQKRINGEVKTGWKRLPESKPTFRAPETLFTSN